jgi:transcriptional regulator with XRE-family HTH domain
VSLPLNWYKITFYTGIKTTMPTLNPRRILGSFIRAHREHLPAPTKAMGRRRTPGWRREELADAVGVSVTWITWLEQGRDVTASVAALTRLAEALKLSSAERASLFDLAGKRDPAGVVEPQMKLLPELLNLPSLFMGPAYLIDRTWTARAWNNDAAKLFVGWLDEASTDRNLLQFVFLNLNAQRLIADWSERTRRLVGEFRADYNRRPQDSDLQGLIDELLARSPEFSQYWREQSVLNREGGERYFNHPLKGELIYLQTTLIVSSQPDCKLVCLTPLEKNND